MTYLFVHLGHILMLVALSVHEIFWLRSILLGGQASLATFAILTGNRAAAFWHLLFFTINGIQVCRILRARRAVMIPADLQDLYAQVEALMSPKDFLDFWRMGSIHDIADNTIVRKGERQTNLLLILSGQVNVIRDGHLVARMERGSFVAEMSFLTGEPATADVNAQESVTYIAWGQESLRQLQQTNPQLLLKIQGVLGKDLITKIHQAVLS